MTKTTFDANGKNRQAAPLADLRSILQWLDLPPRLMPAAELVLLRSHLESLRAAAGTTQQRARALERLYTRSTTVIADLLPTLTSDLALPVPRNARRLVRNVLDLLQTLADETLAPLAEESPGPGPRQSAQLALARSLHVLAQQLMVSHMIASPVPLGAWQRLHQTYATAQRLQLHAAPPKGGSRSLQNVYHAAVLLGCAQPASMTPREVLFLAACFERFADQLEPLVATATAAPGNFWIDPARDLPALSSLRKQPPETAPLHGFSCTRLCLLLNAQIAQLNAGRPPQELDLPDFAATPAGRGVLGRLAARWSDSGKRRFLRRRQSQRMLLSAGVDRIWQLCSQGEAANAVVSTWMISNESPDGYAVMHVSGNTGVLSVGDVAAVRAEAEQNWQICLVRWALSENPEHLELGLQILAPTAVPAILAQRSDDAGTEYLRVLILPEIPNLRSGQSLVVAAGALPRERTKMLLIVEGKNLSVREVNSVSVDEQTGSVEILSIEPDQNPF